MGIMQIRLRLSTIFFAAGTQHETHLKSSVFLQLQASNSKKIGKKLAKNVRDLEQISQRVRAPQNPVWPEPASSSGYKRRRH